MSYTVSKLITKSWQLSSIVAKDLEFVTGEQLTDGLELLNEVIAIKSANKRKILYYTVYNDLVLNAGQELYFVPNLISVDTMTFFIPPVRYSMIPKERKPYFASARIENVQTLPYEYHVERALGGMNIRIYFVPNQTYPTQIVGKFALNQLNLNQDLSLIMEPLYRAYLRYALSELMCQEYNISFQPENSKKLKEYESMITDVSPIDLSMTKLSSLQVSSGINYYDVNILHGWRP